MEGEENGRDGGKERDGGGNGTPCVSLNFP